MGVTAGRAGSSNAYLATQLQPSAGAGAGAILGVLKSNTYLPNVQ